MSAAARRSFSAIAHMRHAAYPADGRQACEGVVQDVYPYSTQPLHHPIHMHLPETTVFSLFKHSSNEHELVTQPAFGKGRCAISAAHALRVRASYVLLSGSLTPIHAPQPPRHIPDCPLTSPGADVPSRWRAWATRLPTKGRSKRKISRKDLLFDDFRLVKIWRDAISCVWVGNV